MLRSLAHIHRQLPTAALHSIALLGLLTLGEDVLRSLARTHRQLPTAASLVWSSSSTQHGTVEHPRARGGRASQSGSNTLAATDSSIMVTASCRGECASQQGPGPEASEGQVVSRRVWTRWPRRLDPLPAQCALHSGPAFCRRAHSRSPLRHRSNSYITTT